MFNPQREERFAFGRKLSRPGAGRLPITALTGFLGAGKSTIIRRLLQSPTGRGTAVIVNEFGEIGIDDGLLRAGSERTMLVGNGCVCCAAQSDLHRTLRELFSERARGSIPDFQRVVIETSGLADPTPLLQTLPTDRSLGRTYNLNAIVTVVDAATGLATAKTIPEWTKQVALADRFLVTKTDLVSEDEVRAVMDAISSVNPFAPARLAGRDEEDIEFLLRPTDTIPRTTMLRCDEPASAPDHSAAYSSFVFTFDRPIPWPVFSRAMETLAMLKGPDLLRIKGFVNVAGRDGPVVVQFVQHLVHQPEELAAWPDDDRRTRLVFITRQIEQKQVEALLQAVFAFDA
jgi:G3E family GTPase